VREDDPERARAFMAMLYRRSEVDVGVVASVLGSRVKPGSRLLDLGGGLLKKLADEGPKSAAELPGDARAIEITAPILGNMGILCRQGDAWALTPTAKGLVEAGSFSMGGPEDNLGPLSRLAPVLAEGGPVRAADGKPMVTEACARTIRSAPAPSWPCSTAAARSTSASSPRCSEAASSRAPACSTSAAATAATPRPSSSRA